jgi:hypothetical protein
MNIKRIGVLAVAMAAAIMMVGAASAEMYVEGYIGGAFADNIGQNVVNKDISTGPIFDSMHAFTYKGSVRPTVIGGAKIGTWFVKEGFLGYSGYPDWCKYLGFYTDLSYQNFQTREGVSGIEFSSFRGAGFSDVVTGENKLYGSITTWAFMFAGRYGFFPDSEVPFGRVQPYLAVGPAIMFSNLKMKTRFTERDGNNPSLTFSSGTEGSTNIALAVDTGVRFMALKNVSFDISFKYRYAQPSYTFTAVNGADQAAARATISPTLNLYSFQAGVAYHF